MKLLPLRTRAGRRPAHGTRPMAVLVLLLFAACETGPAGPAESRGLESATHGSESGAIKVMTWNVYQGAPLDPLFEPGLALPQVIQRATAIWQQVLAANFPARAEEIADQIAAARPHVIGLQEVAQFFMDPDGDGPLTQASDPSLDYLDLILDALETRGLEYEAAAVNLNVDAEVPIIVSLSPLDLDDVRLIDRDVILVREDVLHADSQSANFGTGFPVTVGGITIQIVRGWSAVDILAEGTAFRFVNTHLETFVPAVQVAQALELLAALAGEPLPIVMAGDFNSEADGSTTSTYGLVTGAGFTDAWPPQGRGFTCCHAADLSNLRPALDQRIDFIFLRGNFGLGPPGLQGGVQSNLIGDKPSDRTASGLYPSDHSGIVTSIRPFGGLAQSD